MRSSALAAPLLAALLAVSACGAEGESGASAATEGAVAVSAGAAADLDFTSETVAGGTFDGAQLEGKPTVLWFWAPWCPTCRAQISGVSALAESHGDAVNVVGVGALDEASAIADFAGEVSPDVTMLSDAEGEVWRHFGVTTQSSYLVLDADGRQVESGYLDDGDLADLVDQLARA